MKITRGRSPYMLLALGLAFILGCSDREKEAPDIAEEKPIAREALYDNGRIKARWTEKRRPSGALVPHGAFTRWFDTGEKMMEGTMVNGKKHGIVITYYKNGNKEEECEYKKGKEDGVYRRWTEEGQLHQEIHYKEGEFHGPHRYWDVNGNLLAERAYENGQQVQ